MKKRYLYAFLFGIPGLFVAGIVSIFLFGAFAGILWLFVFGDNPWPDYVEPLTSIAFVLTVLVLWMVFIVVGLIVGKGLERDPRVNRNHVLLSAGLTAAFLLLILFQQWSVGNLEPRSDSLLCNDFCVQHGYSGSGMPPETSGDRLCSCYDHSGNEARRIPLDHIEPDAAK
jgi:hypothetical protein